MSRGRDPAADRCPKVVGYRICRGRYDKRPCPRVRPIRSRLLQVVRVNRLDLLADTGIEQTFVSTVNERGFSHREDLDGTSKLIAIPKVRRDRHRVPASGIRPGERTGAENDIDFDRRKLRARDIEATLHVVMVSAEEAVIELSVVV